MSRHYFRDALLEANSTDVKSGAVRLSFASELPVLRRNRSGKFWEVLSHAPGDARLDLLNRQGVVFENHDDQEEIGTVVRKSVKVEADKKTRAEIEIFDATWQTRAKNEPANIPVSVGYTRLSELRQLPADKDGIITRVYAWEPYEISLLTVEPADDTVGLGRAAKRRCADCDGSGRCSCRESDADEADEDCESCGGNGKCSDCRGNGYFTSARTKKVDSQRISITKENIMTPEELAAKLKAERAAERALATTEVTADVQKAERERNKNIGLAADALIAKHGKKNDGKAADEIRKFANEAIEKGEAQDTFSTRAMQYVLTAEEPKQVRAHDVVPHEELAQFSVMRAIQSAAKSKMSGGAARPDEKELEGGIIKAFEDECRKNPDGGMGCSPEGFIIPFDAQFGSSAMSRKDMRSAFRRMQNAFGKNFRDQQVGVFGAGGALVPTFWQLPIIDILRNKSVLNRVGITSMAGLTGDVVFPRLEATSAAYSLAEIAAITSSQLTFGQVSMRPKRCGNRVIYGKQLVFQSSPDVESAINTDMFKVLALKKDLLGLVGQGSGDEPLGMFNTPGIGAVTFGGAASYGKFVDMETAIRQLNVMGKLAYVTTSTVKGSLKKLAEALTGASTTISGSQNAIWKKGAGGTGEEDGEVNSCQAVDSQQIPNNQVGSGVWENLMEGMWAGLDVVVDYYTLAANAEIAINMNLWLDYAVRHPQAFAISTDAGNQ